MATGTLIGRDREIAEVGDRLRVNRLVTLVGPGGVGKTALALAVAERTAADFPLGVRVVDLTVVRDEPAVPGAIASQMGFDSFDALLSSPNDRPLLFVLDNCEHLLDTVASTILQVLGACMQVVVLATSRSPLDLPGESVVAVAPLPVPSTGDDPLASASVRLFLERARDVGAPIEAIDAAAVAALCARLDGLPLAIEIAAARARTMAVAEIDRLLESDVDVLARPRFRGDPRHRSVADTVGWSYRMLDAGPADLLQRLSVCHGWFPRDTASAVASDVDRPHLDAHLDELVHASLIAVDTAGEVTRYRLLDTIRRFAREQLEARGELEATSDLFVDHVVASVREMLTGSTEVWRGGLLRDLAASYDQIANALAWCNEHDPGPDRAHRLAAILWAIVHQGHADDILRLTRQTRRRWPALETRGAAQVAAVMATAEYVTGHPERALDMAQHTLDTWKGSGVASVTLRRLIGQTSAALGDSSAALAAFVDGAAVGHRLGMPAMAMELEATAAVVAADAGDLDAGIEMAEQVLGRADALGSALTVSWTRTALGWLLLRRDVGEAAAVIGRALTEARALEYPIAIAVNLRSRAYAEMLGGDAQAAATTTAELLDDLIARGALSNARLLVDVTAALAHRTGHPAWPTLAATARSLPVSTLVSGRYELVEIPAVDVAPLDRHDAVAAVRHVLSDLVYDAASSPPSPVVTAVGSSMSRRGQVVEFTYHGRTVMVRASKGTADLARLLAAPAREIHCLDLVDAHVEQGSTGALIDGVARRQYEDRIRELQADIEQAEDDHDYARSYRLQVEFDTLVDHLTAALGHHGTRRRAADNAERARSAVTHRVRGTIRQLDKLHPALGAHLRQSISTGTYCVYRPEPPVVWRVDDDPEPDPE